MNPPSASTLVPAPFTRRAFTLIELLVVITIIGVLASLVLPIYGTITKTMDKTTCTSNLRQVVAATNLAAQDNNGNYPNMHGYSWEQGAVVDRGRARTVRRRHRQQGPHENPALPGRQQEPAGIMAGGQPVRAI